MGTAAILFAIYMLNYKMEYIIHEEADDDEQSDQRLQQQPGTA
jgi:hypothetical protein